ncbi:MAG TPA: hypothetical protein VFN92_09805 [Solirubrobacterales bacterium]|nr:hypothetical protein [Solirubrobacterales bacterium]
MRGLRHGCVLLAALVALLAAGCGGSGSTATGGTSAEPVSEGGVTVAQIEKYPAGSPQRTVLEWWRDLQLNDPEHARTLYLEPPPLPDLAGQFNYVAGDFDGQVTLLSSEEEEGATTVLVRWAPMPGEARREPLRLGRDGNVWKLAEARFIDLEVARLRQEEEGE